jgi:hypothetical protein
MSVPRFDPNTICATAAIIVIASRGSGKSFLCRDLINYMKSYPAVCVICPSDKNGKFYSEHLPDSYVHYEFTNELLNRMKERQRKIIAKALDPKYKGKKIDPRLLIVLDDIQSTGVDLKTSVVFNSIFTKGRHDAITVIVVIQSSMALGPIQRENTDYVFAYAAASEDEKKKLYKCYFSEVGNKYAEFKTIFTKATEEKSCLVAQKLDNSKCKKGYYFYKPLPVDGMINVGNRQFNNYHKKKYRKNWENENKENYR